MYMNTKQNRKYRTTKKKKSKTIRKTKLEKRGGGQVDTLSFETSLIKELLTDNVNNRYITRPAEIHDYTIHSGNKAEILDYIGKLTKIDEDTVGSDILKPVLSKGHIRILRLKAFIEMLSKSEMSGDRKAILISQYIILNQVFGDGNHRAGLYVLKKLTSFSEERIQKIMGITERMHEYNGYLRERGFWIATDGIYEPNLSKMDEMMDVVNEHPRTLFIS
jgi:hypothetical protein